MADVVAQWQFLFNLYAALGWIIGTIVIGWLVYNVIKYRAKHNPSAEPEDAPKAGVLPPHRGTRKAAILLIVLISGILFPLTLGTMQTVDLIEKPPVKGTLVIKVEGFQWGWKFIYPNGKYFINEVRVPTNEVIIFEVTSTDVFHNFTPIDFKVRADAIPGHINRIWITIKEPGVYEIRCFELCGVGHPLMKADIIAMNPAEFKQWYSSISS